MYKTKDRFYRNRTCQTFLITYSLNEENEGWLNSMMKPDKISFDAYMILALM